MAHSTKRLTTADFIEKARTVHGARYDYSRAVYTRSAAKLTIICPTHGTFEQQANSHLSGSGCQVCAGSQPLDLETFLARAHVAHGDRYDYSEAIFKGINNKLIIICLDHGPFEQSPKQHTKGQGCIKCGFVKNADAKRGNLAEFVARAREIHGDKYDYSQVVYEQTSKPVKIICLEHGAFFQQPNSHISQCSGCPRCGHIERGLASRLSQAEFVARAREIHGDKYDYSQTEYTISEAKITIACPKHGSFVQWPGAHLSGTGCPACGYEQTSQKNTYNTADFVAKAVQVHGDRYDYSQAEYETSNKPVIILCAVHGAFNQVAVNHLQGRGCTRCGYESNALGQSYTTADFLARARAVHGNKYDYSKIAYTKSTSKVKIICPEHGEFTQTAHSHMQGSGCRVCGGNAPLDTFSFLARARATHGEKYDYSRTVYSGYEAKVKVACPIHGAFIQGARTHLETTGCPKCGRAQAEQKQRLHWIEQAKGKVCSLYFLRLYTPSEELYKVGITFRSIKERFGSIESLKGYKYEVLAVHQSVNPAAVWDWEQSILGTFSHLSYKPKIYFEGQSECFSSCEEILEIFPL